jgi:hypothetical protein
MAAPRFFTLRCNMSRYPLVAFAVIFTVFGAAFGQPKDSNKTPSKAAREKTPQEVEAERLLKERRDNAQSLLVNLATDARHFTDDTVRARSLARIADMLWGNDPERSRSLFRSAWDAAEIADAKSRERMQEDIRQQKASNRGGYSVVSPPNLRHEVLDLVARRDRALGEEFLNKYNEQQTRDTAEEQNRRNNSSATNEALQERLNLATQLVSEGDLERALQFADPVLGSANINSLDFLARLREKHAAVADQRYAAMLASAQTNPQSDANTISLLAAYIFTPRKFVIFIPNGGASMRGMGGGKGANVSGELRAAFFRTAAAILMHPLRDQSADAIDAQYLAVKRVMPLFEENAPAETVAALRIQFESFRAAASNNALKRGEQFGQFGLGLESSNSPPNRDGRSPQPEPGSGTPQVDREQSLIDQRDGVKTPAERDQINVQLALMMIDKDDLRARDYVEKIDEMELRDNTSAYVDASIAWKLISKKDVDRSLELVRTGELTHFQKVWLLTGTARQMGDRDRDKLMSLIDYAATEARVIETSNPDRPRAFLSIANVVFNLNRPSIWEVMNEAIKAANSADRFTGEDGEIAFRLKGNLSGHQHRFSDFDVAGIFTKLANEDYEKAVELARGFRNEAPRANAVIAIARFVLEKKN